MKYFVLKPEGTDIFAKASREAMLRYAEVIKDADPELSKGMSEWALRELPSCRADPRISKESDIRLEGAFRDALHEILNTHSVDNALNTPDYILADFAIKCLTALKQVMESQTQYLLGKTGRY